MATPSDFPLPKTPAAFRLTRAGFRFLGLWAFVLVAAINSGVNLLYLLFGVMCGGMVLSLALSSLVLRKIRVTRDLGGPLVAGEPADVDYYFVSGKRYWPTVAIHFREIHGDLTEAPHGFFLYLPARRRRGREESALISTRLVARRRGLFTLSTVELSTTFPFGFLRRTRRFAFPQDIVVYPRIGMLNRHLALDYREAVESGAMTANRRGGNDEFYGIREYRPGDNIRGIHWRSSARKGELMVRELASNAPPQLVVVLNLRAWREEIHGMEGAERAIELAAALLCYGFYENFAVALLIAGKAEEPPIPRMGREARALALRRLAELDPRALGGPPAGRGEAAPFPRLAGRAQWVIVTLSQTDSVADLVPATVAAASTNNGSRAVLSIDSPEAPKWIEFLSPADALRLLRDRTP